MPGSDILQFLLFVIFTEKEQIDWSLLSEKRTDGTSA
jgi:hypothetical protein